MAMEFQSQNIKKMFKQSAHGNRRKKRKFMIHDFNTVT